MFVCSAYLGLLQHKISKTLCKSNNTSLPKPIQIVSTVIFTVWINVYLQGVDSVESLKQKHNRYRHDLAGLRCYQSSVK